MAEEKELVQGHMSETGLLAVARVQELYSEFDLDAIDGILVAGELMGWALLVAFGSLSREQVMAQLERNFESLRMWVGENYEPFKARRAMIERLDAGDSGGRLQ